MALKDIINEIEAHRRKRASSMSLSQLEREALELIEKGELDEVNPDVLYFYSTEIPSLKMAAFEVAIKGLLDGKRDGGFIEEHGIEAMNDPELAKLVDRKIASLPRNDEWAAWVLLRSMPRTDIYLCLPPETTRIHALGYTGRSGEKLNSLKSLIRMSKEDEARLRELLNNTKKWCIFTSDRMRLFDYDIDLLFEYLEGLRPGEAYFETAVDHIYKKFLKIKSLSRERLLLFVRSVDLLRLNGEYVEKIMKEARSNGCSLDEILEAANSNYTLRGKSVERRRFMVALMNVGQGTSEGKTKLIRVPPTLTESTIIRMDADVVDEMTHEAFDAVLEFAKRAVKEGSKTLGEHAEKRKRNSIFKATYMAEKGFILNTSTNLPKMKSSDKMHNALESVDVEVTLHQSGGTGGYAHPHSWKLNHEGKYQKYLRTIDSTMIAVNISRDLAPTEILSNPKKLKAKIRSTIEHELTHLMFRMADTARRSAIAERKRDHSKWDRSPLDIPQSKYDRYQKHGGRKPKELKGAAPDSVPHTTTAKYAEKKQGEIKKGKRNFANYLNSPDEFEAQAQSTALEIQAKVEEMLEDGVEVKLDSKTIHELLDGSRYRKLNMANNFNPTRRKKFLSKVVDHLARTFPDLV